MINQYQPSTQVRPVSMTKFRFVLFIILAVFVVYSRYIFKFGYLYSWDSVQFALSISEYNVTKHQPHPPGYILYSLAIKATNQFGDDPNLSMIALNIIFTIIGCLFLFLITWNLFKIPDEAKFLFAFGAATIYATNPINWFYGSVAEIYALEGGLVSVLTYLLLVSRRKPNLMLLTSLAFGIVGGTRLTTEIFLMPAYIYVLSSLDRHTITKSIIIILLSNLAWVIPVAALTGGIDSYMNIVFSQAKRESTRTAGFNAAITSDILIAIIQGITIPLLSLLLARFTKIRIDSNQRLLILAATPALIFFLFIHYAKPGYMLFVLPLLIALSISLLTYSKSHKAAFLFLILSVAMNLFIFLKPPIYAVNEVKHDLTKRILFKLTSPNKHTRNVEEQRLKLFFEKITELGSRKKVFVIQNGYWPDWRIIMYYYPNDTAVLLLPKKHAVVAEKHLVQNERQPILLKGDERIILTIGQNPLNSQMRSFQVDGFTYYYGYLRHFPNGFRIYQFQFFKEKQPKRKTENKG